MKTTCDLHDDYGEAIEVLPHGLVSYGARVDFRGPVETLKCFEDNSRLRDLSRSEGDGRVLVVDAGASLRTAVMGDRIAERFAANGWAGVVIWGAVRDIRQLRDIDLGILALGHIPRHPVARGDGQVDVALTLGEARVDPYGYLVHDEEGTVIFPPGLDHPFGTG